MKLSGQVEDIDVVRAIVRSVTNLPVFLFGSRAKGEATANSDLDLCVKGNSEADLLIIGELRERLSESSLPYTVDISDFYRLSAEFQAEVEKYGIPL